MKIPARLIEFAARIQPLLASTSSRHQRIAHGLEFQKLEPRQMLAGDVTVFLQNINLMVVGDDAANQIQIIGTLNGGARVVGLDGTTINGGDTGFVSSLPGLRTTTVQMNGGNDEVDITGARFNKGLVVQGNAGDDMIMVRNSSVGSLNIQGGNGADMVEIQDVFAIGASTINTHTGDDTLVVYNHAAGGDISLQMGAGHDVIAIDQMGMFGKLALNTGSGNDRVLLAGKTWIGRNSNLMLGAGDDFLAVMPSQNGGTSQLQKFTNVVGGAGNDNIAFDAEVSVRDFVDVAGNGGTDSFSNGSDLKGTRITGFENSSFDVAAAMDEVYTQIADLGVDPTLFGGSAAIILSIQVADSSLSYTEGAAGLAVDSAAVLTAAATTVINSATVSITNFVANQDILEFSNVGNLTGVFDDTTGVLTFSGTGTATEYQNAVRSVTYRNSSEAPSETARTIDFTLNTDSGSETDSRTVNVAAVADAPVLTTRQDAVTFDLDDSGLTRPLLLDTTLTLTDVDTTQFSSAKVMITAGQQAGDLLAAPDGSGFTSSYDSGTGVLTITGDETTENYQKLLQGITFDNSDSLAPLGTRTIQFEIGDGTNSVKGEFDVNVVATDTIGVTNTAENLVYTETQAATAIDADLILNAGSGSDPMVDGATVNVTSGFDADQDTLTFTPVAGISGSYDAATGTLTFSNTASAADYQTVLRSVTFENSSFGDFDFSTSDRVVEFAAERNGLIATSSRTIAINEIAGEQQLIQRYLDINGLVSQVTESGLHFIVQQEGDGNFPNENSDVTVRYRGTLLNGTEFDANQGLEFNLQGVIEGWTEGIPKFSTGGSGILLIPSDLGYGTSGNGPDIGPNSILYFEVELLSFT